MTYLSDLMPLNVLRERIREGYVRTRKHPADEELMILNYTEKAQYERVWDEVTTQCRGLIIQASPHPHLGVFDEALVVARPWPKFFNWGEIDGASEEVLDAPAMVQDKMDGSLGILYSDPEAQWSISTRGSFESEQAIHATAVWRRFYEDYWAPRPGYTYLFEIVYPDNRIVLDYGTTDDLFLLDILETATGRSVLLAGEQTNHGFPGRTTSYFFAESLREALTMGPRPNAEGLVVTLRETGAKIKIKQEDYVRLHKLVTGLNERAVWEHLSTHDGSFLDLLAAVPDEFHRWVETTAAGLLDRFEDVQSDAWATYHNILRSMPHEGPESLSWGHDERKMFAGLARECEGLTPFLFQMLDGRDISAAIWKSLRPKGETNSLVNRTEDNS